MEEAKRDDTSGGWDERLGSIFNNQVQAASTHPHGQNYESGKDGEEGQAVASGLPTESGHH